MEPEAKGKAPKGQGSRQLVMVKLSRFSIRKICSHYSKPAVQVQGGNGTTRPWEEGGHQSRDLEFKIPSPILSCPCTSTVKKKIWVSLYGLQGSAYPHPASQCDPLQRLVSLAGAGP